MLRDRPFLSCPYHGCELSKGQGQGFSCPYPSCSVSYRERQGVYDFIGDSVSNHWDHTFNRSVQLSVAKRLYDAFVFNYLTPVFNSFLVKYIRNNFKDGARLIELGCGEATASISLLRNKKFTAVLVDNNDLALNALSERLKGRFEERYLIVKDDFYGKNTAFKDNSFDISFNIGTIEHFDDPVRAVNEMKRLAPVVICIVPTQSIYWMLGIFVRKLIERDASHWITGTRYYKLNEFTEIFRKSGFSDIRAKLIYFFGVPLLNCVIARK